MGESRPSEEAIALFTNVFGYAPDPEALHAGECWQAERIDAALRRAKVEGMREAGKIARANAELLRPPSRQFELNMVNKAKSEEAGMIADEIDARAAQIEEGEHDDSHTSNG